MKRFQKLSIKTGLIAFLFLFSHQVFSGPPLPGVPGSPHFCWGLNGFDQCVLFLGTEESCKNVSPGLLGSAQTPTENGRGEPTYCQGENEFGECVLYIGDETGCDSLIPCRAALGQMPRAPRVKPDNGCNVR